MSSMHEVSDEGREQHEAWLMEHISDAGMEFIERLVAARTISEEQGDFLVREVEARLSVDPYEGGAHDSPWDQNLRTMQSTVYLVNAYHVARRYGGPEEGGWWYTHYTPLSKAYMQSHGRAFVCAGPFATVEDACEVRDTLNAFESTGLGTCIEWRIEVCAPYERMPMRYC